MTFLDILLAFASCAVQGSPESGSLSLEEATLVAAVLGCLCPVASLHLYPQVRAVSHSLAPWHGLRSLELRDVQQGDVAAVVQLTQLQALSLFCSVDIVTHQCGVPLRADRLAFPFT